MGSVLLVAADPVANGSRHFDLSRKRAGGSHQEGRPGTRGPGLQAAFYVRDGRSGAEWEAVALAEACIAEWQEFFTQAGLSITDLVT